MGSRFYLTEDQAGRINRHFLDQPVLASRMDSLHDPMSRDDLISMVKLFLPNPVQEENGIDGCSTLLGGDPGEVVVRITSSTVSVSVFAVRWDGPHTPVAYSKQLGSLNWKRLAASEMTTLLSPLICTAQYMRRMRYRQCERCGETKPPEWMHGDSICQSCAEQHLSVVH